MSHLARLEEFIKSFGKLEAQMISATRSLLNASSQTTPQASASGSAATSSASSMLAYPSASATPATATVAPTPSSSASAYSANSPPAENLELIGSQELFALTKKEWMTYFTQDSGNYDEPWSCAGTQTWLLCWWKNVTNKAITKPFLTATKPFGNYDLPTTKGGIDYYIFSGQNHEITIIHQLGRWTLLQSWVNHFHLFPHLNERNKDHNLYGVDYAQIKSMLKNNDPLNVQALKNPLSGQKLTKKMIRMPTEWEYIKVDLPNSVTPLSDWLLKHGQQDGYSYIRDLRRDVDA